MFFLEDLTNRDLKRERHFLKSQFYCKKEHIPDMFYGSVEQSHWEVDQLEAFTGFLVI